MNFNDYLQLIDNIDKGDITIPPYDNQDYKHYTELNNRRLKRWLKTGHLSDDMVATLEGIKQPQHWVVITEPWCGDASQILPWIYKMSMVNDAITLDVLLRDSGSEIDQYLTNGTKSIPILIVRDAAGNDLLVWGPRPKEAQDLFVEFKRIGVPDAEIKLGMQNWYNDDKGVQIQREIGALLESV